MTGYARMEGRSDTLSWVWEAKSVNGRGLDMRLRVPNGYDALDVIARDLVAKALKRGNVQVTLNVTDQSASDTARINAQFLEQVLSVTDHLRDRYPHIAPLSWDGVLGLKGIIEQANDNETGVPAIAITHQAAITASLVEMLAHLVEMRTNEGRRMATVLSAQIDEIEALAHKSSVLASLRPEAQKEKLRAQVLALLDVSSSLAEDRLTTELALLAVKADVREELDRLASHVAAARDLIEQGGAVGRKLDFLSQEFNREANTLCSKAQDVELTRIGLDLKVVIDQFREQVQNIE